VNPVSQDMGPFNWVIGWHEVMPAQHMAALLEGGFFPKWHQVQGGSVPGDVWGCIPSGKDRVR